MFFKFIKFSIVGLTGLIVDFGFTYLLKEKVKLQQYIANAVGFSVAATTNYYLNRIWTFHSLNPDILIEYTHFIIVSIIGLGINSLVLWFLVSKHNKQFYLAKFIAIVVTTLWNFMANLLYTFS